MEFSEFTSADSRVEITSIPQDDWFIFVAVEILLLNEEVQSVSHMQRVVNRVADFEEGDIIVIDDSQDIVKVVYGSHEFKIRGTLPALPFPRFDAPFAAKISKKESEEKTSQAEIARLTQELDDMAQRVQNLEAKSRSYADLMTSAAKTFDKKAIPKTTIERIVRGELVIREASKASPIVSPHSASPQIPAPSPLFAPSVRAPTSSSESKSASTSSSAIFSTFMPRFLPPTQVPTDPSDAAPAVSSVASNLISSLMEAAPAHSIFDDIPVPTRAATSGRLLARDVEPTLRDMNVSKEESREAIEELFLKASNESNLIWIEFAGYLKAAWDGILTWSEESAYFVVNSAVNRMNKAVDFQQAALAFIDVVKRRRHERSQKQRGVPPAKPPI